REPFRVVLAREILTRLAMRDSVPGHDLEQPDAATAALFDISSLLRYQRVLSGIAYPYIVDSRGRVVRSAFPPRSINASAGLVSTVHDLASYDRALSDHILLRRETQELAWTPAITTAGQSIPYGLGWFTERIGGERAVWHYGLLGQGASPAAAMLPRTRLAPSLAARER